MQVKYTIVVLEKSMLCFYIEQVTNYMQIRNYLNNLYRFYFLKSNSFIIYITNRCNAGCGHCFYSSQLNKESELTLKELTNIVEVLSKHSEFVILTGGEPFLRSDITDIFDILHKNNIKRISLTTNGSFPERVKFLINNVKHYNFSLTIQISLDGIGRVHDDARNLNDSFNKAIHTANIAKSLGVNTYFLFTITKKNYKQLGEIVKFMQKLDMNIGFELIRGPILSGLSDENRNNLNPEDTSLLFDFNTLNDLRLYLADMINKSSGVSRTLSIISNVSRLEFNIETLLRKKSLVSCVAGDSIGVIYPSGDIALCEFLKPLGNIVKENYDFLKLWNGINADRQRELTKNCYCTHSCFIPTTASYKFLLLFAKLIIMKLCLKKTICIEDLGHI